MPGAEGDDANNIMVTGKRTRHPTFKKKEAMSQQAELSLGLRSKHDRKQAARKDAAISKLNRA